MNEPPKPHASAIRIRLLERYLADQETGHDHPVEVCQKMFPGYE